MLGGQMTELTNTHRSAQLNSYIELLEDRLASRKILLRTLCTFCESYLHYSTDTLEAAQERVQDIRVYRSVFKIPATSLTDHAGVAAAYETLRKVLSTQGHSSLQRTASTYIFEPSFMTVEDKLWGGIDGSCTVACSAIGTTSCKIASMHGSWRSFGKEQLIVVLDSFQLNDNVSLCVDFCQDETGVLWAPISKASAVETEIMEVNKLIFQLFEDAEEQTQQDVLRAMHTQRKRAVLLQTATLTQSVGR